MKNYRIPFLMALAAAVLLAAGLVYVEWRSGGMGGLTRATAAAHLTRLWPFQRKQTSAASSKSAISSVPPVPEPLTPVQLSPQRLQSIGVKTSVAEMKPVFNEIRAAGNVDVDEQLLSYVQLRFSGWIQRVFANYTFQYVRKGQPLFTIYSPDLVTTEQEYLIAKQNQYVLAGSTVPGVAAGSVSLLNAAAERLEQWQIPPREIARLKTSGQARNELEIDSPASGYITERNALPQMYVQPETRLYAIAGLSAVWVYANIFQDQIGQVKPGDPATVLVDSYPGRVFDGRVDYIWPEVDTSTRTVKVRMAFSNPGMKLMPGMFVDVDMKIPLGRHVVIPAAGVLQTGTQNIVFIDRGDGYLEPRNIVLGPRAGDEFIVLHGLKAGERIVTSANFLIDSESQLQAALGSFTPPPPGAGAAAAMNALSAQAAIQFTTSPSPPHAGNNILRVKLTGADGRPLAGASVTTTFFMAAMPAMGMSALRAASQLADQGGGNYEGAAELRSGGTWQVTIVARKAGQTIATKQLTVDVAGGMGRD